MGTITRSVVGVVLGLTLAGAALAEKPPRSACKRETQGRFWPEEANTDRKVFFETMRSGELQMCSRGIFRYNWERLTVSAKAANPKHEQQTHVAAFRAAKTEEN